MSVGLQRNFHQTVVHRALYPMRNSMQKSDDRNQKPKKPFWQFCVDVDIICKLYIATVSHLEYASQTLLKDQQALE